MSEDCHSSDNLSDPEPADARNRIGKLAAVVTMIDCQRTQRNDPEYSGGIERSIINSELRKLEQESDCDLDAMAEYAKPLKPEACPMLDSKKIYWPRWWRPSIRLKQAFALIAGLVLGFRLPGEQRCIACGAPCRRSGGYLCPVVYDRKSCTNRMCGLYMPF